MLKTLGVICGFGVGALVVVAAVVGINVAIVLGIVWVVKTVLF